MQAEDPPRPRPRRRISCVRWLAPIIALPRDSQYPIPGPGGGKPMAERILAPNEIAEMEKLTVDRVVEAIDTGDTEGAKKLARRMYNEFLSMHDLYRNWAAATLSFIGKRYGDQ